MRIKQVTQEHLDFIQAHGDRHITQRSFNYYHECLLESPKDDILLELRAWGVLIGISFAAVIQGKTDYSIVVVHRDFRDKKIGTYLLSRKACEAFIQGIPMVSVVSLRNPASVAICKHLYSIVNTKGNVLEFRMEGEQQ